MTKTKRGAQAAALLIQLAYSGVSEFLWLLVTSVDSA